MPAPSAPPRPAASGGPGSLRARLRLGAALALGLLAALSLVLAVWLYFFAPGSQVAAGIVGVGFGVAALVYGLLTRAVVARSRVGHLIAGAVCLAGAVFSVSASMGWCACTFRRPPFSPATTSSELSRPGRVAGVR